MQFQRSHQHHPPQHRLQAMEQRRQQSREMEETAELVNAFVLSTAQFLNRFAADCEQKLYRVSRGLDRLETQTTLLEFKMRSVEGEDGRPDGSAASSRSITSSPTRSASSAASSSSSRPKQSDFLRIEDRPPAKAKQRSRHGMKGDAEVKGKDKNRRRREGESSEDTPPRRSAKQHAKASAARGKKSDTDKRDATTPRKKKTATRADADTAPDAYAPPRFFLLPPALPVMGGDNGFPVPPPPPLPPMRAIRGPPRDPNAAGPRLGSSATYTMRQHPRLRGYFALLALRVPVEEVQRRMQENGVNPAWLSTPDAVAPADLADAVEDFAEEADSEETPQDA